MSIKGKSIKNKSCLRVKLFKTNRKILVGHRSHILGFVPTLPNSPQRERLWALAKANKVHLSLWLVLHQRQEEGDFERVPRAPETLLDGCKAEGLSLGNVCISCSPSPSLISAFVSSSQMSRRCEGASRMTEWHGRPTTIHIRRHTGTRMKMHIWPRSWKFRRDTTSFLFLPATDQIETCLKMVKPVFLSRKPYPFYFYEMMIQKLVCIQPHTHLIWVGNLGLQ